jgi:hypothetical protein
LGVGAPAAGLQRRHRQDLDPQASG